jgi:hypothetical protein
MASKPKKDPHANPPDLPEMLATVIENARSVLLPVAELQGDIELSTLFGFLSPMVIKDPRYRGDGKAPRVLREPLLLTSWDRRAGRWKCSLTDKVLNVSGSCLVSSLCGSLMDLDTELRNGSFQWSERKIT